MRENPIESRPALLGRRVLAYLADYGLILIYVMLLFALSVALRVPTRAAATFENPWLAQALGFLTLTLPVALFLTFFESSKSIATPGKRLLGLVVFDLDGRRLGRGRAFVRSLAKLLPWELAHVFVWRVPRTGADPFPLWLLVGFCLVRPGPASPFTTGSWGRWFERDLRALLPDSGIHRMCRAAQLPWLWSYARPG